MVEGDLIFRTVSYHILNPHLDVALYMWRSPDERPTMTAASVRTRVFKNGNNGWYWEVVANDREVLERGVALKLDGARARADNAKRIVANQRTLEGGFLAI
jgi:chaperone required for assembly of F1-ATPase